MGVAENRKNKCGRLDKSGSFTLIWAVRELDRLLFTIRLKVVLNLSLKPTWKAQMTVFVSRNVQLNCNGTCWIVIYRVIIDED